MAATIAPASGANGAPSNQKRPNQTLYCSNLPDKLQKDDLKRALYMLFLPYGPILDIVTLKTTKMRGQAHVLFRDVQASTQALRSLQGYEFFGKQMNLSYANTKSDTLAKLDGTYKQPEAAVASAQTQASTLQQSIFAGPPAEAPTAHGAPGTQGTGAAPPSLAPPPSLKPATAANESVSTGQGVKRAREESDEEDEAPMDMDDAAMDESDDD